MSVDIMLAIKRDDKNVQKVLYQGADIGCRYWDKQDASNDFQPIFITPIKLLHLL